MRSFVFSAILLGVLGVCQCGTFNRQYVGVAYSPYTDPGPVANRRLWDGYKEAAIRAQLTKLRNQFSSISTYSMGTASYNAGKKWFEADSNAIVAQVAAKMNKENPKEPKLRPQLMPILAPLKPSGE
ncbi:unnamed protein product [Allacma fusca]|uniref:Uncharacterized protein n=1 Tax=Allacma fusca TaxID=39272 RepID=A0A8J2LQN9_9HEXA|nr:unnamed protein product [Allacma fusca]